MVLLIMRMYRRLYSSGNCSSSAVLINTVEISAIQNGNGIVAEGISLANGRINWQLEDNSGQIDQGSLDVSNEGTF